MIYLPDYLWERMLSEFERASKPVEQVAYLDGVRMGEVGIATTLTIPAADCQPGRFEVSADAMSAAGKHLRAHRLVRMAQVHTHPSTWTGHSAWDDQRAYSQRAGAISLVLPHYGHGRPHLADIGVHFRDEAGWRQLSTTEAEACVHFIPSLINLRDQYGTCIEPPRRRPWWSFLASWRNRTH